MSLPHILLGLLRIPASGYDLKNQLDEYTTHFWPAELSQIYPTLKRLEKQGWLSVTSEPPTKGPARLVYLTTATGKEELKRWLRSGPQFGNERYGYLAQIAFIDELGNPKESRMFLASLRARLAARLAALSAIEAQWAQEAPNFPDELSDYEFYAHLNLRNGLIALGAKVRWCDESIGRLERRFQLPAGTPAPATEE
ncbi:MAG: PadR family transcriptional regulator [Actinomycetota bacterium]